MPICHQCGSTLEPGQLFCDTCGSPVTSAAPPSPAPPVPPPPPPVTQPPPPPPTPPAPPAAAGIALSPKLIIAIVAVLIIAAAVVFFVLPKDSGSAKTSSGAGSAAGSGLTAPGASYTLTTPPTTAPQAKPTPAATQTRISCPSGMTECRGTCRDLWSDEQNCGMCNFACPQSLTCSSGQCLNTCPSGFSDCDGSCKDLGTDEDNCGSCGNTCTASQVCRSGRCTEVSQGLPATTVVTTVPATTAAATQTQGCPSGQTLCSGSCRSLQTDTSNCGSCGNMCPANQYCAAGLCTCSGAYPTKCGSACVNVRNDNNNCGSCGKVCPANVANGHTRCDSGSCLISCNPDGHLDCNRNYADGCEVYIFDDEQNCGNCGIRCEYPKSCIHGSCLIPK